MRDVSHYDIEGGEGVKIVLDPQSKNFQKLAHRLFERSEEREFFAEVLAKGRSSVPALLWMDEPQALFDQGESPAWLPPFVTVTTPSSGAGSHPLHDAGCYYCLDLSSVFQGAPLFDIADRISTVVDICASPGGKSVLSWRTFRPDLVVCNEVIGKRIGALVSNLERCGVVAQVTNSDVGAIAKAWPDSVDLVLVDAPCSGQSLIARGMKAPSCFHPATINMNSNRQKRIIANASAIVRPGGLLLYTTCTFSFEENEGILQWFLKKFPEFLPVEIPRLARYRSAFTEDASYRLFPQHGDGAGGFTALLRKSGKREVLPFEPDRLRSVKAIRSASRS